MSEYKERARRALEKHHESLLKSSAPKRKNQKPEKVVQVACVDWMRIKGWDVQIYEAKATFDPRRQVWRNQAMRAGVSDCMGLDSLGSAVFVEFKAPGRRSSFNSPKNFKQKRFLVEKIARGAFGVVVDDVRELERIYLRWIYLATREEKIAYLMSELP